MARFMPVHHLLVVAVMSTALTTGGCTNEEWRRLFQRERTASQPQPSSQTPVSPVALQGAIGQLVTIDGLRLTYVRGFGLVVDLVDAGGSDGPEIVKNYLMKEIRRQQDPSKPGPPAQETLESKDSAMVEVTGLMPAGAKKGDRFDVVLRALGTQTKSLVGGRLVLCDLKLYAEMPGGVIEGATVATAGGPIFVSPFDPEGKPSDKIDLRSAWVLGGGVVKQNRRIRLVLNDPRYSAAQQIVARLNGRYGATDPAAVGQSPSFVDLHVPDKFQDRKRVFLEQALFTTLNSSEGFLEQRARDLAVEIAKPAAEYESIGLAWEAIGPLCLPIIRELYTHSSPEVAFYAGRSGLRLGDRPAVDVVAKFARDPDSPLRKQAIDELGFAEDQYGAREHLCKLLNDPDVSIRIRAYKGLRRRPHPAIESKVLYQDNLVLDVVDSKGPYLIYAQRSMVPRVAVFGKQMACRPPAIFPGERRDGRRLQTQISAAAGDESLTLIFSNKRTGRNSPPLKAPLAVAELIEFLGGTPIRGEDGQFQGLGTSYSEIVDILGTFCEAEAQAIPATFVVEDLTGREEYQTEGDRERKESEY
jgi:flagellar basal body P-ring protein FlgI